MKVPVVEYQINEKTSLVARKITCIGGIPFYRSSGYCSGAPGTWFPFLGLLEEKIGVIFPRGYLIKPQTLDYSLQKIVDRQFESGFYKTIIERFGDSLYALVLSSQLGGGIWDEPNWKKLKKGLQATYTPLFSVMPKFTFVEEKRIYEVHEIALLNKWLLDLAGLEDISAFCTLFNTQKKEAEALLQKDAQALIEEKPKTKPCLLQ